MALGNIYENGLGLRTDLDMAAYNYKLAANFDKPYALYKTAYFIEKGINQYNSQEVANQEMLKYYTNAMDRGSDEATIRLAQIYEKGEFGIEVDKQKAYEYYQEVPDSEESMNSIGSLLYDKGEYKRAADLFRK